MERDKVNILLKDERNKKDITIDEIAEETRIPLKYIYMIEKGEWDHFPSKVHLRGFLKIYCEYLGFEREKIQEVLNVFEDKEEKEESNEENSTPKKEEKEKILVITLPIIFFTIYFFTLYLLSTIAP